MKKLTCHCGGVEIQVKLPETGFEKLMRCNCSLCKRRGYIMTPVDPKNFKIIKGQDFLKLYHDYFSGLNMYKFHTLSKNNVRLLLYDTDKELKDLLLL